MKLTNAIPPCPAGNWRHGKELKRAVVVVNLATFVEQLQAFSGFHLLPFRSVKVENAFKTNDISFKILHVSFKKTLRMTDLVDVLVLAGIRTAFDHKDTDKTVRLRLVDRLLDHQP